MALAYCTTEIITAVKILVFFEINHENKHGMDSTAFFAGWLSLESGESFRVYTNRPECYASAVCRVVMGFYILPKCWGLR